MTFQVWLVSLLPVHFERKFHPNYHFCTQSEGDSRFLSSWRHLGAWPSLVWVLKQNSSSLFKFREKSDSIGVVTVSLNPNVSNFYLGQIRKKYPIFIWELQSHLITHNCCLLRPLSLGSWEPSVAFCVK